MIAKEEHEGADLLLPAISYRQSRIPINVSCGVSPRDGVEVPFPLL
jgi:hypothetical protein